MGLKAVTRPRAGARRRMNGRAHRQLLHPVQPVLQAVRPRVLIPARPLLDPHSLRGPALITAAPARVLAPVTAASPLALITSKPEQAAQVQQRETASLQRSLGCRPVDDGAAEEPSSAELPVLTPSDAPFIPRQPEARRPPNLAPPNGRGPARPPLRPPSDDPSGRGTGLRGVGRPLEDPLLDIPKNAFTFQNGGSCKGTPPAGA